MGVHMVPNYAWRKVLNLARPAARSAQDARSALSSDKPCINIIIVDMLHVVPAAVQ